MQSPLKPHPPPVPFCSSVSGHAPGGQPVGQTLRQHSPTPTCALCCTEHSFYTREPPKPPRTPPSWAPPPLLALILAVPPFPALLLYIPLTSPLETRPTFCSGAQLQFTMRGPAAPGGRPAPSHLLHPLVGEAVLQHQPSGVGQLVPGLRPRGRVGVRGAGRGACARTPCWSPPPALLQCMRKRGAGAPCTPGTARSPGPSSRPPG